MKTPDVVITISDHRRWFRLWFRVECSRCGQLGAYRDDDEAWTVGRGHVCPPPASGLTDGSAP